MVSKRSDERPTEKVLPATLYLAYLDVTHPGLRGSDRIIRCEAFRIMVEAGHFIFPAQRMLEVNLILPSSRSGYREERDGSGISRHLQVPAESIIMNVGGPYVEGSIRGGV
jgi:hypothetical protein